MAPLLHRQPFKAIYFLAFLVVIPFIRLPCWLIYHSWRPNRPRRTWTLRRTVGTRMIRKFTQLPLKIGLLTNLDLSLEALPKGLGLFNARYVWVPELGKEDIVGMVGERAARAGVESIAIPAYWILKNGIKWSPEYEKAREDEKVLLYFHGGAFVVRFFSSYPVFALTFVTDGNCVPTSPNSICPQGNTQIFYISLQSVIGRLPTQLRASFGIKEPVPSCGHRRSRGVQVPCLQGRIRASKRHRRG